MIKKWLKKRKALKTTKITRCCIFDYLSRYEKGDLNGGNRAGLLRGATIHMKELNKYIDTYKLEGLRVGVLEDLMLEYKDKINSSVYVEEVAKSMYADEMVSEGWYTDSNRAYILKMINGVV